MNKELNIGDYVRTKYGIGKIVETRIFLEQEEIKLDSNTGKITQVNDNSHWNNIEDIIKSSPNIIDLIEEGDYVNGLKVEGVNNEIKGFGTIIFSKDSSIMEDYIYSIVTHEMFESMEYKVGNKE